MEFFHIKKILSCIFSIVTVPADFPVLADKRTERREEKRREERIFLDNHRF